MKATNKFWDNFIVECGAPVPEKYHNEPAGHKKAEWHSQNGDINHIVDLDDMYIANIYRMLFKSLEMAESETESIISTSFQGEMAQYYQMRAFDDANDQVEFLELQLHHIAYEVHKRGLFINAFNKSEEMYKDKTPYPTVPCPVCHKKYFTKEQAICCADADIQEAQKKTRKLRKLIK